MRGNLSRRLLLAKASFAGLGLSLALPQLGSRRGSPLAAETIRRIQSHAADLARA